MHADINECTTSGVLINEVVIASGQSGLSTLQSGADFGMSVVELGVLDKDGMVDLAVGAPRADVEFVDDGEVYLIFLTKEGMVASSGSSNRAAYQC